MVFYFSGTGNTRFAAQGIAKTIPDELYSMNELIREGGATAFFNNEKPFVFVCPTYAWRIPKAVEKFILNNAFSGNKNVYFVMTCSTDVGMAGKYVRSLCEKKGLILKGFTYITGMPSNYIAMYPSQPRAEAETMLEAARPHIIAAGEKIRNGESFFDWKYRAGDFAKSALINPLFNRFYVRAEKFYSTDACVGCGKCEKVCPLGNIKLSENRPVWGGRCTHCMSCICSCPAEAIEYGKVSAGQPRIYNVKDF